MPSFTVATRPPRGTPSLPCALRRHLGAEPAAAVKRQHEKPYAATQRAGHVGSPTSDRTGTSCCPLRGLADELKAFAAASAPFCSAMSAAVCPCTDLRSALAPDWISRPIIGATLRAAAIISAVTPDFDCALTLAPLGSARARDRSAGCCREEDRALARRDLARRDHQRRQASGPAAVSMSAPASSSAFAASYFGSAMASASAG